ncbi:MAG TPA: hypothetical protein VM008_13125 [Phycisphaerae bacterium]|nr:hypothetical protein [Phycisphaerae bacterium]
MRRKLHILKSRPSGVPYAEVPLDVMWGLVEYLSWQRVLASYNFATTHFTVTFPHLDAVTAQKLLDDWDAAQDRTECAESHDRSFAQAS